jgi:hypothetical protein
MKGKNMNWKNIFAENLADLLRFIVRAAMYFNLIMVSLGSIYFVAKFVWYSLRACDRILFSHPW